MSKWDNYYLGLAEAASNGSKDPSTKVGSVIVDTDNRIVSTGFNGFPRGIEDTEERLQDRQTKYKLILHAEFNALIFCRRDIRGATIYTWPFMPCQGCALMIIQAGIGRVVSPKNDNPRWQESFEQTKQLFKEAGVELNLFDRQPSQQGNTQNRWGDPVWPPQSRSL